MFSGLIIEDKNVKGIYLRSIDLINNSRGFDLGNDDLIANLETRVERFEKIMKTSPLPVLIEEEVKLLSSSIENIEKNIKSFILCADFVYQSCPCIYVSCDLL